MIVIHFDATAVYEELRNPWILSFEAADVSPFENLIERTKAIRSLVSAIQRNDLLYQYAAAAVLDANWHRMLRASFP